MKGRKDAEQIVALSRIGQAATALSFASIEHRLAVIAGNNAGLSVRQIAFAAGTSTSTIQRMIEQHRDSGAEKETT